MSDRKIQTDDIDRIREEIQAELDGSWGFDSLQRLDRLTADAADVAEKSPDEVEPLADPLAELLSRTVNEEYSTAGEMIGKENLLCSVKQQTASSLAEIASESPQRVAPVLTELTRVAIREDDEDVRDELETVFHIVAGEDHDAACEAVAVLEGVLDHGDVGYRSKAVETVGWIGYHDSAAVADLVDRLQSLVDEENVGLSRNILEALSMIVEDPLFEETMTPESVIAFGSTVGAYLSDKRVELRTGAALFLKSVSNEDPSVIRDFVPELADLLVESEQARSDAGEALGQIGTEHPEAIGEVMPRLRTGLTGEDPDLQQRTAEVIKNTAGGRFGIEGSDSSVVVELVPELTELLVKSEQARPDAGEALERIGTEHPEAIGEVTPRLRTGLSGEDPNLQEQTAEVIKATAEGDPSVVVELVPELTDLLVGSEQARFDAGWALKRIGSEHPKAIGEVTSRLRVGLTGEGRDQEQTAEVIKETAEADPTVVVELIPELTDLLVESGQARSDAGEALKRIGTEHPEAIGEVTPRLRAGLSGEDPDLQERTVEVVKATAGEGGFFNEGGDPSVVVELVPELTDLLVESEQARSDASEALERIGTEHPEAIGDVISRLQAGLTGEDPDLQKWTARVIKGTAEGDSSIVVELVPELTDLLVKSEQPQYTAGPALNRIGEEYPEAIGEITPRLRAGLTGEDPDQLLCTIRVIKATAGQYRPDEGGDSSVVVELVPELTDLLVGSVPESADLNPIKFKEVRISAAEALKRIGTEHPEAIGEVTPRLRAGLTGEDPVHQARTADVIKEIAEADPGVVVELVPELTNLLVGSFPELTDFDIVKSNRARFCAGLALKRIGTEHPEAVGEVTPRLRAGFTGEDPVKQGATAEVIKETAEADPTVVVELVPELTNLLVGSVPELTDLEETAVRSGSLGPEQARSDAGEALERIGVHRPKPVKTALSGLSDDIHSFGTDIRTQIAKLLRGGAEAHPSVFLDFYPELTALLDDEVYEVRKNAAVALAAISEGDPTDLAVHRSKFRELIAHEDTTHEGKVVLVGVLCRLGSETIVDPVADR